jgi:hypothetical protein
MKQTYTVPKVQVTVENPALKQVDYVNIEPIVQDHCDQAQKQMV